MPNFMKRNLSRRDILKMMGAGTATALVGGLGSSFRAFAQEASELEGEVVIWNRSGDLFNVFDATIPAFNELYPNITVRHEALDINSILPTALATGVDLPDGAFYEDVNIPLIAEQLYDISAWIEPYLDDIVPFKVRVNTQAGRIVGVPYDLDPGFLFYRQDLLEEAGIDPDSITTYDELVDAAKALQAALGADVKPIHLEQSPFLTQLWVEMFANQQGASLIDESGALQINSEPYLRIMEWLKRVGDEGVGTRAEYFSPGDIAAIEAGQVAFYPWAIWFTYGPENLFETTKGLWRAMALPAWTEGGARGANMGGSSFVIPRDATNPELAWKFYEFQMFNPAGFRAVYGPNDIYPGGINTSIPSYKPAWEEQLFDNPEGLGGQNLWELAVSTAEEVPGNYYYPTWYGQAVDIFGANIQRLLDGQMTPQEVLTSSAADIQSRLIDRQ